MSRTDLDVDNVFLKKSLDAISRRHFRAEELYDNIRILRIATDRNLWIVPSFSQIGEAYQVRRVSVDPHTCNMYCSECEACMHEYICDCPDATKGNFCKHIHVVRLNFDTEEESQNTEHANHKSKSLVTANNKNHKKVEKSTTFKNLRKDTPKKRLCQEANATVTGFVSELDQYTSDEAYKEIIQTIKKLKSRIEAIEGHDRSPSPIIDPCS